MTAPPSPGVGLFVAPHSKATFAKESRRPVYFCMLPDQLHVKPNACIAVKASPVGVAASVAARMIAVGGSHASSQLGPKLRSAGARTAISDLRTLKSAIIDLRGW